MLRRAISQTPRFVACATSKRVVFSSVILYVDMVVSRELELQDVAKPKLAEERRASDIKEVPLIVAKVTETSINEKTGQTAQEKECQMDLHEFRATRVVLIDICTMFEYSKYLAF